jgi:hypothetical protein
VVHGNLNTARWVGIINSRRAKNAKGKVMKYTKPVIVAQNSKQGSYAAGCPEKTKAGSCRDCEVTR